MPASGWMKKWRTGDAPEEHPGALVHAAARGDAVDALLDLGVATLLRAGIADRAGLWLAGERRGTPGRGCVVERKPGPLPEQWKKLDISTPFLRAALECPDAIRVEFGTGESIPDVGPLVGMHDAVWLPLRTGDRTVGLAMVAYARAGVYPDLAKLRAHVDEIALGVEHHRNLRREELASDERRAHMRLSRAVLCGVSVESILPQIARAARHYAEAEFVAIGRSWKLATIEGWDGSQEWRTLLQHEAVRALWRQVGVEGRQMELGEDPLGAALGADPNRRLAGIDRIIALPIELRNQPYGVLLAGLMPTSDASEDIARLESYSLLAALAVEREAMRAEGKDSAASIGQLIEESGEFLIVIDQRGQIREASDTARRLLQLDGLSNDVHVLEDPFCEAARGTVAAWRQRFCGARVNENRDSQRPVPLLGAFLNSGSAIRLEYRFAFPATNDAQPRWLIRLEDQNSRQASLDVEGRLEAEMLGIMDSIDSGVLLLDSAGKIRVISDRLGQILGVDARRVMQAGTVDALIHDMTDRLSGPGQTAARWREHAHWGNEANWDEFEIVRPSPKIVERFARPLFSRDGARVGWLEVYRDITASRLFQSKLLQTEKMAALGQLVSGVAHELNNPLTSIQGYAQLLLSRRVPAERAADAQRISQEAGRAGRIVKNLLQFSRETAPERSEVDLNEIIERTVALRSYEFKIENIALELDLEPTLPHVLADSAQLQQVLLNLLLNSEQAIQQGRSQDGEHGQIRIRTRRLAGERISLEVSDDGPGIPSEIVSRIFDPFFTTKAVGVGTGLGLAIIYGIVQEHRGQVTVQSTPGEGATLTVELPSMATAAFEFAPIQQALPPKASVTQMTVGEHSNLPLQGPGGCWWWRMSRRWRN